MIADLSDPVAAELVERLPASAWVRNQPAESDWPEQPPESLERAHWLILHRTGLPRSVLIRLRRWRLMMGRWPTTVLILGPHVRYADLRPWSDLADEVIDEPTALAALERRWTPSKSRRRRARVSPTNTQTRAHPTVPPEHGTTFAAGIRLWIHDVELRLWLREWLEARGEHVIDDLPSRFPLVSTFDRSRSMWLTLKSNPTRIIWEVPALDPSWPDTLSCLTHQGGPVVALIGLANRDQVAQARRGGAAAVLDLPFDPSDLEFVLDRLELDLRSKPCPPACQPLPGNPNVPTSSHVDGESRGHAC